MNCWKVLIAGMLACQTTFAAADASPLTLAKDGKTAFIVITATEPTIEEQTAATWLSETLEQVTSAKFPIRAAGKDDASDAKPNEIRVRFDATMKPEEWRIQTVEESLLLTGGKPRGAIYAVCEFLETQVGVERLDPFTEFVPKQPTLMIPMLNRRGQPAFPYRFVFTGWPYQNWAPMGVNGVNGARWRIWNKEHIYAGPVNGDYPRAVPDGVHTFGHFISAKEFAVEHPEYFSMDAAGKRMMDDIPWTDLPTEAKPNDELRLNIATYPKLDSKTPSRVSSPWLIGTSPTYNPAYYGSIRLGAKDGRVQRMKGDDE